MTIPDEAVQAGVKAVTENVYTTTEDAVTACLTAALPFLTGVKVKDTISVKKLEWGKTSYGTPEVFTDVGVYRIVSAWNGGWSLTRNNSTIPDSDGRSNFSTQEAAKAAAQPDYSARILSAIEVCEQDGIADAVIQFFVKNGMLDVRSEYDASDVLSALEDNYTPEDPSPRAQALEEAAKIAFDVSENGEYHGEASVDSTSSIYQQGAFEVYEAIRALSPHSIQFKNLPKEKVSIPDPNNPDARIVGFRIREGDEAWGDTGLSEPLFWLDRFINFGRALSSKPVADGWLSKAQELYQKCNNFPENSGEGFMALLQLRNHVADILPASPGASATRPTGGRNHGE